MNAHFARLVVASAELGTDGMLLAKITLLLAAAWLVQAALGRFNPRWRVLVWRVTGSAIVLLCVLALSPPFLRLAILPGPTPELAAGDTANPATSLKDRAELRDPNRRIPAAADATATEAEQLTDPDGADGTTRLARPRTAHADRPLAAPHAVDALPDELPAFSDDKPAWAASRPSAFWLLGLWCAGAGLYALMTFVGLLRLRTIRRTASSVPDWVQCESAHVASALGVVRGFELRQTQSLQTPCLVGVLGPMILLPARQCESQYSDELPAILAHELAHLKGGDLFWNAWLNALAIGLWFHPLAWRMRLAHADACDAVCDALASDYVGDAGIYGRTLARLTLRITEAGAAPGLAMARVSSVERRIAAVRRHVFRAGLSRRRAALTVSIATAAIAVLGGLAFVPSQAEPPKAAAVQVQPSPAPTKPQESPTIGSAATQGVNEAQPAAKSRTLRKVFAAWEAREDRIKSFYFAWTFHVALHKAHQTVPDGYCFPFAGGLVLVDKGEGAVGVDKDVEFTAPQSEWSGDGFDRLRSDYTEFRYRAVDRWTETRRFRLTQDGILNSRLQIPVRSADEPWITIWRKAPIKHPSRLSPRVQLFEEGEIDLTPLRLALRPSRTAPEWSPENCQVISEDAFVGNAHCIQLQMDKVNHSERCWVDPQRDYSVVRWQRRDNQLAPLDFAIEVQRGPDHEWLPQRWSWRLSDATGGRAASFDATVTRRMINKKLPATTFVADYPRGTRVYDATVDLPNYDTDDQSGMLPPEEARATLNAIADAWMQRQSKAQRWKYTWRTKGARNTINTLAIDGEKFMKAQRTLSPLPQPEPAPDGREGWPILQSKRVFDGAVTRELWLSNNPARPGGILNITAGFNGRREDLRETGDSYLSLIFRPFDPRFGGMSVAELRNPARFQVRKQKGKIGNVACVVIETEERPGMQASFWLDPARDYIPLRLHRIDDGEDLARLEISYKADPTCGWIPIGWTEARVRSGVPAYATIVDTITDFMVNQPIPASDFQIDAPPNVTVQDLRIDRRSARRKARDAALDARDAKQKALAAARAAKEKVPKAKPVYDPFADPAADLAAAFKLTRETNKRVLIEFGANWCPGCRVLGAVLKENAEVSAALKKDFVLVFVNTESESGRKLQEKYVPKRQQNSIPHLAVLDASGRVLKNDDTKAFEIDDDYSVPKLKAFLAEWSPK
jgi:beta-lactamase regulating signal transducer with metallopeptidase domain/thiol-disulfide isomerase/thioredoxin